MSDRDLMQESRATVSGDQRGDLRLGRYERAVQSRLERWESQGFGRRLWAKDHTVWSEKPVAELTDRLGWLKLPESMRTQAEDLARFAQEIRADGFRDAVVLGMGGSSLAPEVFARTYRSGSAGSAGGGHTELSVLDSTHPEAVRALVARLDPTRTLFLVSSKSGSTTEMMSFFYTFWQWVGESLASTSAAGRRFVAITDPGSGLEKLARERGFRAVFNAQEDVGGRYSALTPFGLVPAALVGADVRELLIRARAMAEACTSPASSNPGLQLGAALGELALAGRDKVTFLASPGIESFPDWIEQLIAESTGKIGRGIVPVVGERPAEPAAYGDDRFFAGLFLGEDQALEQRLAALELAGHPVARFRLSEPADLGREMFRWEMATAAAGAVLGVNPFDQPDVQLAKELAKRAMQERSSGAAATPADEIQAADAGALGSALQHWLAGAGAGTYLGIHAYLAPTAAATEALHELQALLRDRTRFATTLGYGPRFLHSTGQLHKGGPEAGRFLQIVDEPGHDLPVPETDYTFGELIRAQADGDRKALEQRGRRVMRINLRVNLGADLQGGLARLREALGA
jgi:transaldolase/glucose-6-phosphate isomerase